ncbi:hypothetical protein BBK82_18205 [Lentzea guizhouensis]|uniref:Uncharacterized protein n=1 Tax=Lentzea guizhouensis TaxID=1586287 RepID=A0A1B2HJ08_9PSEU|nr:hypothetical protein [Lentzea guizhouensis]ANZ37701.1 hypothetical protein BBK82_18205 [Lentzea guizhouensis]
MAQQYEYFAILTPDRPSPEDPLVMCRRWVDDDGQVHEEVFTSQLVWVPSTAMRSATTSDAAAHGVEVRRVDEERAARFQDSVRDWVRRDETWDGRPYSYLAWLDGSTVDDPTGVLRTWTTEQGGEQEQRYLPGTGWRDSYIREDWHRGRQDGRFDPIDKATAEEIIERWEQRRAEQG